MNIKILEREVFFNSGKAVKWNGDKCIKPIFGRNWFYYIPHFSWNKGIPFKHACTDVVFSWLIYHFGVTVYWNRHKHDGSCQLKANPASPSEDKRVE